MNPPRRLRGTFGMCNLREGFVNLREGFVVAPWRLREAFSKTRSAKASRSPLEGFAKASRRRHGRLHLETIRQKMTSPRCVHPPAWVGKARCGAEDEIKKNRIIIPIVCLLSTAVYVRNCADRRPYRTRTGGGLMLY